MKYTIDPGKKRPSVNFIDNITFSHVKDLDGKELDLQMSIMLQNGNSEMRIAAGADTEHISTRKPAILWVPGGGYRGADKNLMTAEMEYLVEEGYVVASMYYRSSAQGHYPDQIIDVKTALRFLRAHADQYEIDPERIGVMGRSAGGHLSAVAGMNTDGWDTEEWSGYSSKVQAAYDMFGPVDIAALMEHDEKDIREIPNHRWKTLEETHAGALLGGDPSTLKERAPMASVNGLIGPDMAPILIMHGDADMLVPKEISEAFYQQICDQGMEERADLYILKHAGHGTPEFFQPETKKIVVEFFDKYLKA